VDRIQGKDGIFAALDYALDVRLSKPLGGNFNATTFCSHLPNPFPL
jgi:hypothetical protein